MSRSSVVPLIICVLLAGCVERRMIIVSNPPGAEVYLDGTYAGMTPLQLPFAHFATHDVLLRHPGIEQASGGKKVFRSKLQKVWLQPPWWQMMPIDFFVEHVWPATLTYEKRVEVELDPLSERTDARIAAIKQRAEGFRAETAELMQTDPLGHTNPPPADPDEGLEFDGETSPAE